MEDTESVVLTVCTQGQLYKIDKLEVAVKSDTNLDQVCVDADQTADVSARDAGNGFDGSAHHENGSLDALAVEIFLLAKNEVGAHNANFLTSLADAGEDASESVEAAC